MTIDVRLASPAAAPPPGPAPTGRVQLSPVSDSCQRWRHRSGSWRHPRDGGFDPRRYRVVQLPEVKARSFVAVHHYSGSFPVARLAYGLVDTEPEPADLADPAAVDVGGQLLAGVAVLAVPMQRAVLTNVFPELEPYAQSLELSRFVLLPSAPSNAESWFLGRLYRLAADTGLRGVVSFADPMPRRRVRPDGTEEQLTPGHVGVLYQAANGVALGRSTPRRLVYVPRHGVVLPARTLQKVTGGEVGAAGAERQLVLLGARPRSGGQDRRVWLRQALDDVGAVRVAHPGNFRYAWALGDRSQRRRVRIVGDRTGYPKPDRARLTVVRSG